MRGIRFGKKKKSGLATTIKIKNISSDPPDHFPTWRKAAAQRSELGWCELKLNFRGGISLCNSWQGSSLSPHSSSSPWPLAPGIAVQLQGPGVHGITSWDFSSLLLPTVAPGFGYDPIWLKRWGAPSSERWSNGFKVSRHAWQRQSHRGIQILWLQGLPALFHHKLFFLLIGTAHFACLLAI